MCVQFLDILFSKKKRPIYPILPNLIRTLPRAGYIQGNPKLRKEGTPLGVIISGRSHATEGIAELAEKELGHAVEHQPSFIRNNTDIINNIQDVKLPVSGGREPILVFFGDVSKLHPSHGI